jgi:ketosteroid isomerase-like protein
MSGQLYHASREHTESQITKTGTPLNQMMMPEQFVEEYESALATHDWARVEHLVDDDACVIFSTGTVHRGKAAVGNAFAGNFQTISEETYRISNIHWVRKDSEFAVYLFDFDWSGIIGGKPAEGGGRGTCVLVRKDAGWRLLVEHLGPRA